MLKHSLMASIVFALYMLAPSFASEITQNPKVKTALADKATKQNSSSFTLYRLSSQNPAQNPAQNQGRDISLPRCQCPEDDVRPPNLGGEHGTGSSSNAGRDIGQGRGAL